MGVPLALFVTSFHGVSLPSKRLRPSVRGSKRRAPATRTTPTADLSATDRAYLQKVRARLLKGKPLPHTSPSPGDPHPAPSSPTAPSSSPSSPFSPPETAGAGGELFAEGMSLFNRGQYAAASRNFLAAVGEAGEKTARGGRLSLWLAQAQDAAGCRADAVGTLEGLCAHMDADVARTAGELLFIVTAPRLELGADHFVEVPSLDDSFYADGRRRLVAAGLEGRPRKAKMPEKHSLEWYVKAERPLTRKKEGEDNGWVLLAGVAAGGAAFLLGALGH